MEVVLTQSTNQNSYNQKLIETLLAICLADGRTFAGGSALNEGNRRTGVPSATVGGDSFHSPNLMAHPYNGWDGFVWGSDVRGSQICRWKRGQFAAPTAIWCAVRCLGVVEVLSRRNLEGITPILRHCGTRSDCRSDSGRQEAPGVTTKLLQSLGRSALQPVQYATK